MNHVLICRSSIVIPINTIKMSRHDINVTLNKHFTLKYKPMVGKYTITAPQFLFIDDLLIIPKMMTLTGIECKLINPELLMYANYKSPKARLLGEDINEEVEIYYPPLPELYLNQDIVCDYLMEKVYNTDLRGCVLIAPTGEGKTYIIMGLFARIGGKMLLVIPTEAIMQQTIKVAETVFGNYPNKPKVTTYYGKKKDISGDIVIAIINSLIDQPPEFFDDFTFTAFDEAPDYCSKNFSQIFWKAQSHNTIAVTATPNERADQFDTLLSWHVGPYIDVRNIPNFVVTNDEFKFKFNLLRYDGDPEYTQICMNETIGIINISKMITNLCMDPYRASLIISRINLHYAANRHIYVFCERRSYCTLLADILKKLLPDISSEVKDTEDDFYILMGGVSKKHINDAYESTSERSIILTTYSYLRRGVSVPRMDTIILATPRRSGLTQVIGRITRRGGNTDIVRIVDDIIDIRTPMSKQLSDRRKAYKLRKGEFEEQKYKFTELRNELSELCSSVIGNMDTILLDE